MLLRPLPLKRHRRRLFRRLLVGLSIALLAPAMVPRDSLAPKCGSLLRALAAEHAAQNVVGDLGGMAGIQIEGAVTFDAAQLLNAISSDAEVITASHPCAPLSALCGVIQARVHAGYYAGGFPDAAVAVEVAGAGEDRRIHVTVAEGRRYRCGEIRFTPEIPEPLRRWLRAALTEPAEGGIEGKSDTILWRQGVPVRFDEAWRTKAAARASNVLGAEGYPGLGVELTLERSDAGAAALHVGVKGDLDPRTIDAIAVSGLHRSDANRIQEWLASDVGLHEGAIARTDLLHRVHAKLERSGCFVDPRIAITAREGGAAGVRLEIVLAEDPRLPRFGDALTPAQLYFLAIHDWLAGPYASGEQDLQFALEDADGATMARFACNARVGTLLSVRWPRNEGAPVETTVFIAGGNLTWYAGSRRRVLSAPFPVCVQFDIELLVGDARKMEPPVNLQFGFEFAMESAMGSLRITAGPNLLAAQRAALEKSAADWAHAQLGQTAPVCDAIEFIWDDAVGCAAGFHLIDPAIEGRCRELWRGLRAALAEPLELHFTARAAPRTEPFWIPRRELAESMGVAQVLGTVSTTALATCREYWELGLGPRCSLLL